MREPELKNNKDYKGRTCYSRVSGDYYYEPWSKLSKLQAKNPVYYAVVEKYGDKGKES